MTSPDPLRSIERKLQTQLWVLAAVALALGTLLGDWRWGVASAAGVGAAMGYYRLLAIQIRAQLGRGSRPALGILVGCLAMRQLFCLAVPGVCCLALGTPWLASLVTLVVARHWILPVAWLANRSIPPSPEVLRHAC